MNEWARLYEHWTDTQESVCARRNRSRSLGYSLATRIPYREEYVNTFIDNFIYVYKGGIPLQNYYTRRIIMFFNSYEFIFIFFPISLCLYWGSCHFNFKKYANIILLMISIIFYINLTDIIGIIVILVSIISNFALYKVLENNTR